ncbi:NXPE family member 3-like isoform X2 [Petromyzon marinus]|uniref:NXPE family member 3-like isoform X2 n=1 Tax=Petromyzon marinus TaxID=7757 RepID=UPI003F70FD8E
MMKMDSKSLPPSRIFRSWLLISLLALSALVFFVMNVSLILTPSHKPPRHAIPEPSLRSSTSEPHDLEMDDLRQLLWWPSLPATSSFDFESSTSPAATSYRLLGGTRNFTVGDTLYLGVQARDHHGRDKRHGGDYFRIKVYSDTLRAGAFGSVLDHNNGSYTASVVLPWPGEALVDIKLVHSSEAVQIISRLRDSVPNKIFFTGYFEKEGARSEATECNAVPRLMIKPRICKYRDVATGHMWFCKKPRTLPCDSLRFHSLGGHRNILTKQENRFFSNNVSKVRISGDPSQIEVQPSSSSQNLTNALGPCVPGHPVPSPSGFYLNDEWVSLSCKTRPFPALQDLANCLSGKRFYMYGDSTIRQWFLHLTAHVPALADCLPRPCCLRSSRPPPTHVGNPYKELHSEACLFSLRLMKTACVALEKIACSSSTSTRPRCWAHSCRRAWPPKRSCSTARRASPSSHSTGPWPRFTTWPTRSTA